MLLEAEPKYFAFSNPQRFPLNAAEHQLRMAAWMASKFGLRVSEVVPDVGSDHFPYLCDLSPLLNGTGEVVGITLVVRSSKTSSIPEPRHIDVVSRGLRSLSHSPMCGAWFQVDGDRVPI